MILTLDMRSRTPIYEQMIASIKEMAVKGILAPDEQLPSVRQLAADLCINPNTVQRAYNELERQGVIYSLPGRGNFISAEIGLIAGTVRETKKEELKNALLSAKAAGVDQEAAAALLAEIYGEGEKS